MAGFTPFYLNGAKGKLFALYYPAVSASRGHILHIPAFAEELNRSRRMVALQSRAFSAQGYGVLVLDLFGTGDSEGDFGDASLALWQEDIIRAGQWLMAQGAEAIHFWGLRSGALLAMSIAARAGFKIGKLLCWQPVLDGKVFAMQFIRLRTMAAILGKTRAEEKTSTLAEQLLAGEAIEVAGYWLSPELINPYMGLQAAKMDLAMIETIIVLELVHEADKAPSFAYSQFAKEQGREGSNRIQIMTVVDSPFWLSQDSVDAYKLIDASLACLV